MPSFVQIGASRRAPKRSAQAGTLLDSSSRRAQALPRDDSTTKKLAADCASHPPDPPFSGQKFLEAHDAGLCPLRERPPARRPRTRPLNLYTCPRHEGQFFRHRVWLSTGKGEAVESAWRTTLHTPPSTKRNPLSPWLSTCLARQCPPFAAPAPHGHGPWPDARPLAATSKPEFFRNSRMVHPIASSKRSVKDSKLNLTGGRIGCQFRMIPDKRTAFLHATLPCIGNLVESEKHAYECETNGATVCDDAGYLQAQVACRGSQCVSILTTHTPSPTRLPPHPTRTTLLLLPVR